MKRLEELGISPAPWKCTGYYFRICGANIHAGEVKAKNGVRLCVDIDQPDARLIAASPKMYEEQYHDCLALRTIVRKIDEGMEVLNLRDTLAAMADRMEAALAEAAGEEVCHG